MAEAYARQFLPGWEARSAGVERQGLDPRAVAVMAEDGLDISGQRSKLIEPDYFVSADLIVTLCGDAKDKCPTVPAGHQQLHWDLADPARLQGSDKEVMNGFRAVRDKIKQQVLELAERIEKEGNEQ